MSATTNAGSEWEHLKSDTSRQVEEHLGKHFERVDAYRYNSASLRVRIVDPSFEGLSREERDDRVEKFLAELPAEIQADIINLVLLYPGEPEKSFRAFLFDQEFEHPTPSML